MKRLFGGYLGLCILKVSGKKPSCIILKPRQNNLSRDHSLGTLLPIPSFRIPSGIRIGSLFITQVAHSISSPALSNKLSYMDAYLLSLQKRSSLARPTASQAQSLSKFKNRKVLDRFEICLAGLGLASIKEDSKRTLNQRLDSLRSSRHYSSVLGD